MRRALTYSRLIAWLKILLPLTALALMSTLFLLSRPIDPTARIPFAEQALEDRIRTQQVTAPFFAGQTKEGHNIAFRAELATPNVGDTGHARASAPRAEVEFAGGQSLTLSADNALVNTESHLVDFSGSVRLDTSTGFEVETETLTASLRTLYAKSDSTISARSPAGTLTAGSMELRPGPSDADAYLVFQNGVKLIYVPQN